MIPQAKIDADIDADIDGFIKAIINQQKGGKKRYKTTKGGDPPAERENIRRFLSTFRTIQGCIFAYGWNAINSFDLSCDTTVGTRPPEQRFEFPSPRPIHANALEAIERKFIDFTRQTPVNAATITRLFEGDEQQYRLNECISVFSFYRDIVGYIRVLRQPHEPSEAFRQGFPLQRMNRNLMGVGMRQLSSSFRRGLSPPTDPDIPFIEKSGDLDKFNAITILDKFKDANTITANFSEVSDFGTCPIEIENLVFDKSSNMRPVLLITELERPVNGHVHIEEIHTYSHEGIKGTLGAKKYESPITRRKIVAVVDVMKIPSYNTFIKFIEAVQASLPAQDGGGLGALKSQAKRLGVRLTKTVNGKRTSKTAKEIRRHVEMARKKQPRK